MMDPSPEVHDYSVGLELPQTRRDRFDRRSHSHAGERRLSYLDPSAFVIAGGTLLANGFACRERPLGRSFQTHSSSAGPGSTSTVNLLWGFTDLTGGYMLVCRMGACDARDTALGLGTLLLCLRPVLRDTCTAAKLRGERRPFGETCLPVVGPPQLVIWIACGFVSNVGTWVRRTGQDWLVLTVLTHHSASAVGIVTALQFAPQLLLLSWTGLAADRFNQHRLLITT